MTPNKRIYVDMDGVLVNLEAEVLKVYPDLHEINDEKLKSEMFEHIIVRDTPRAFYVAKPIKGAEAAYQWLAKHFDTYLLSTPMWQHPRSFTDKRLWVEKWLGQAAEKRLILSHNKGLVKGAYLIDDRIKHGVDEFEGEHIHFGQPGFTDWTQVIEYLKNKEL